MTSKMPLKMLKTVDPEKHMERKSLARTPNPQIHKLQSNVVKQDHITKQKGVLMDSS